MDAVKSPHLGYDIVVEGKIFKNWLEYGKLGGWLDMHRLVNNIMYEYFKVLFPKEIIGEGQRKSN